MLDFAYLTFAQRPADLVRYPDGAEEFLPPGEGVQVVERFNSSQDSSTHGAAFPEKVAEPDDAQVQAVLDELTADWEAALARLDQETTPFGNPEGRRASFVRRNPKPTFEVALERLRAASTPPKHRRRAEESARVESLDACWWMTLEDDEAGFDGPVQGPGPLPRGVVAHVLTRLSRDGWDVRHVSEERAAFHGQDQSRAVCVAMNVMISRPSSR